MRGNQRCGCNGMFCNQPIGHRIDRNIFETHGNDGHLFIFYLAALPVFGKKYYNNLKGRARHGEAYDLDHGRCNDGAVVVPGGGLRGEVKGGGTVMFFFSLAWVNRPSVSVPTSSCILLGCFSHPTVGGAERSHLKGDPWWGWG